MKIIKGNLTEILKESQTDGINEFGEKFQAIQLLPELRKRYPTELKKNILSVRFYQTEKACYLEITEIKNPDKPEFIYPEEVGFRGQYSNKDYVTNRESLAFIADESEPFFKVSSPVTDNAFFFLKEYDDWSMLNTINIFSKEGEDQLFRKIEAENSRKQ